jgi:hypothetical protein
MCTSVHTSSNDDSAASYDHEAPCFAVAGMMQLNWRDPQLAYLEVTVQEKLRSGRPGPFAKVEVLL